jgi:hypothetical protein
VNDVAAWISERLPPDEDLDVGRMAALATDLGRERELWGAFVRHDPDERVFVELYRDVHVDVWLICWLAQQDTGFHDHDVSAGAVYVCDGVLIEDRLQGEATAIRTVEHEYAAGTVFEFDAGRIHRMRHPGGDPATSIHVYSPALWRMGHYHLDDDGNLCRSSVTYADEMWSGRVEGALRFAP